MANALREVDTLAPARPTGTLVLIVGPSGVGKDSIIKQLGSRYAEHQDFLFVQRWITREPDHKSEPHVGLTEARFEELESQNRFAVTWSAHGLRYGLPMEALVHVRRGGIAIANGSRRSLHDIINVFGSVEIICLTIDSGVLEKRLIARGRETSAGLQLRLRDATAYRLPEGLACRKVDNSGELHLAVNRIIDIIEEHVRPNTSGERAG